MDVVCRMLGIEGPHDAFPVRITSSRSMYKNPLWIDYTKCLGNESSLLDCDHPGLRNKNRYNLESNKKAFVACGRLNSK